MNIRACKYEDILAVAELEKSCFKGEGWSYGVLASSFQNPAYVMAVAEDGEDVIGYGCYSLVCDEGSIENVVVAEQYRESGVGTAIVGQLLNDARERGVKKVFLEVRVSNSAAMKLYLSCGFKGVYARTRYYSDGEDCLVMSMEL